MTHSYTQAIDFLYNLRLFGTKFGLENTRRLAELAGNPHQRLRFIHVAGTNGKGSACAMLESIYREAGLKVGLFTSPHLIAFGERIQINRRCIDEAEIVHWVGQMRSWIAAGQMRLPEPEAEAFHPTFFEAVTVMAMAYFAREKCDLVIWETGLGGRLDATNIVTPLASVITNVQFDHQQWLGDTLAKIAFEKGGIIKPGIPALTATDIPEALEVLQRLAREAQAPLIQVHWSDAAKPPLDGIKLPLRGEHQRLNAALVAATVGALSRQLPVDGPTLRRGLEQVFWAGRLQLSETRSGQKIMLDGAHNPAGAGSLRAAFCQDFPHVRPTLILGIFKDKDWRTMCDILAPMADRILLTPVHSDRTALPESLREACLAVNPLARVEVCHSLPHAFELAAGDPFLVIAGSLYLVGEAMELMAPIPSASERALNEWTAANPDGVKLRP
jgi:dihydrofolate synthase/folylpolyglutamate synthase